MTFHINSTMYRDGQGIHWLEFADRDSFLQRIVAIYETKYVSKTIVIFAILCSTTSRKDGKQHNHFSISTKFMANETISESQCTEWFARSNECTSVEDKPGRGQPSEFDDQALLVAGKRTRA
ncbi:histone-lysine N-methyltransferase SETMAR [Trichonephila clavipes]|nr:histone-lysine N-methyltransferase SETMAR [Trichonephila clavipes]